MINQKYNSAFALDNRPQFRTGLVTDFNPTTHAADVKLEGSESLTAVPVLGMFGASHGSDLNWTQNLRGAFVVLILINNSYHILSTLPPQVQTTEPGAYVTGGVKTGAASEVETLRKNTAFRNFNPNRPTDLLCGDKCIRAEGGAEVGLLQGGVARLKASSMAQLVLGKFKDFGMLITRRFKMYTDFGEVEFKHDEAGNVSLNIEGGSSFASETHPSKKISTIVLRMGHCGADGGATNRLYIETKDTAGKSMTKVTLGMDGKVNILAKDEAIVAVSTPAGAPMSTVTQAKDGKVTIWAKGDYTIESAEGKVSITAKSDVKLNATGAVSIDAKADVEVTAAGSVKVVGSMIQLN